MNKVTRFFKCPKTGFKNPSCNGCDFKHTRGPETGEEKIFPDLENVLRPGGLSSMAQQKQTPPTCPKCRSTMFESIPGKGVYRCPKPNCDGKVVA